MAALLNEPNYRLVELPAMPPSVPRRGNAFTRTLGRFVLWLTRFRVDGAFPDTPRFVMVGAPHTSNWDAVVGLSAALSLDLEVHFFVKREAFRGPLGWFLRAMGGIPVDRTSPDRSALVDAAVEAFATREAFLFGVAPEGTRSKVERWKTGFHRIAVAAGVPIVPIALDFGRRRVGPRGVYVPTGDLRADLEALDTVFHDVEGQNPARGTRPTEGLDALPPATASPAL